MELEQALEEHRSMIHSIINGLYIPDGLDRDDLEQEGMIGLWKACERFKSNRQVKFSTFAYVLIKNEILSLLRKNGKYDAERFELLEYHSASYEIEKEVIHRKIVDYLEGEEELLIYYLYLGYTQREIAVLLHTTQPRICQRIRMLRIKGERLWGNIE